MNLTTKIACIGLLGMTACASDVRRGSTAVQPSTTTSVGEPAARLGDPPREPTEIAMHHQSCESGDLQACLDLGLH
jgi:hypothetical protein